MSWAKLIRRAVRQQKFLAAIFLLIVPPAICWTIAMACLAVLVRDVGATFYYAALAVVDLFSYTTGRCSIVDIIEHSEMRQKGLS